MRLGITMRSVQHDAYPEARDALSKDWSKYIYKIFPRALLIPLLNHPSSIIRVLRSLRIQGVILSNGEDWGTAPDHDQTEKKIIRYCLKNHLPIFGVCRGMQILNLFFGGRIDPDIRKISGENHVRTNHGVELMQTTPFIRLTKERILRVNSYHNEGVRIQGLARSLKIFARTSQIVEGLYHPQKPILAIQWHPERKNPSAIFDRNLIKNFFSRKILW